MLRYLLKAATVAVIASSASSVALGEVGIVERVIDGNTFVLADGTVIRLWGIQTPEPDEPGYIEATEALASLVVGQSVDCLAALRGPLETDDHLISWCLLSKGGDIASWLVTNGYASDWPEYSGGFYAE